MPAGAQATRTWVSGLGDDANPCSRTAPCKTFPGAYSKTAVGGEIDVIDPGGYGVITIGHAITIDGGEKFASILSSGTNGIVVNAGPSDVVTIRRIAVNGVLGYVSPGLDGVKFNSGLMLILDRVVLENFSQHAVNMSVMGTSYMSIVDSEIQFAGGGGVLVTSSGGTAVAAISDTAVIVSNFGVQAGQNAHVAVTRVYAQGNGDAAMLAQGPASAMEVNASILQQSGVGIHSKSGSHIWYADSMVTNNGIGILTDGGGTTTSFLNNRVFNNMVENMPTNTLTQN